MRSRWAWILALPYLVVRSTFPLDAVDYAGTIGKAPLDEIPETDFHCFEFRSNSCAWIYDLAQALNDANEKRALRKILDTKGPQYQCTDCEIQPAIMGYPPGTNGTQYQEWNSSAPIKYGWPDKTPTGGAK